MKIRIGESNLNGKGIFATDNIQPDEIIETCEIIYLNQRDTKYIDNTALYDYYFAWKDGSAIALGYGSLFNHSYDPNALYEKDFEDKILTFRARKFIPKDTEITVNYNYDPECQEKVWFEIKD